MFKYFMFFLLYGKCDQMVAIKNGILLILTPSSYCSYLFYFNFKFYLVFFIVYSQLGRA